MAKLNNEKAKQKSEMKEQNKEGTEEQRKAVKSEPTRAKRTCECIKQL